MMQAEGGQIASFREIHKNAWLKRIPPNSNNKLLGQKKVTVERWWTVFCVHGDVEPFLEGYTEAGAVAAAHAPRWRVPLVRAIHVSGSVGPARPHAEYEFVVALQDGAVRLIAPSWESMQDWVDTLRNKLREMKILSPKENVYSKAPEQTRPRAPTRDPTSPLPAPPPGPIIRVPGTEPSVRPPSDPPSSCDISNNSNRILVESSENNVQADILNVENVSENTTAESNEVTLVETSILDNTEYTQMTVDVPSLPKYNNDEHSNASTSIDSLSNKNNPKSVTKVKNTVQENESEQSSSKLINTVPQNDLMCASRVTNISLPSTSVVHEDPFATFDYNKPKNSAISQKSLDDSVSKVEMDFSRLVFNSEYPSKMNMKNEAANCINLIGDSSADPWNSEFTSSVANVSGMNICLIDSVLDHRMKAESDKEFFTEFDVDDNSVLSAPSCSYNNVVITESGDVKAKYAQVDLKAKTSKLEKFKQNLLEPSSSKKNENSDKVCAVVKDKNCIPPSNKLKPAVSPRTIIFKNINEGLTNPIPVNVTNVNNQVNKDNFFIDENVTLNHTKAEEPALLVDRKKNIHNKPESLENTKETTTLCQSESSILDEQNTTSDASNVTIITVSNNLMSANTSKSNTAPIVEGIIKINHLNENLKSDNIPVNTESGTFILDGKTKKNNEKNQIKEESKFHVSIGSGYGHIRHSTTIGVKSDSPAIPKKEKAFNNARTDKNILVNVDQPTASNILSPINSFQTNISDNTNVSCSSSKDLISSNARSVNTSQLNIKSTLPNVNKVSFDKPTSIKLINISPLPNNLKQTEGSSSSNDLINLKTKPPAKSDEFYESVFTPFTVSKTKAVTENRPDTSNVPNSLQRHSSEDPSIQTNKVHKNNPTSHSYEFLSWKESENAEVARAETSTASQTPTSDSATSRREPPTVVREVNLSEYRPQSPTAREFVVEKLVPPAKNTKHGLFTRGLTELNIMCKFRNMAQSNSSRAPLLKNSQFYSYVDMDPPPTTSDSRQTQDHRKDDIFTSKLNHFFNKTSDNKNNVNHGKPSEFKDVLRIESSLRRNWSEHNDRTVLPVVKNAAELKVHRSSKNSNVNSTSQNISNSSANEERQMRRRSSSLSENHTSDDVSSNLVESPRSNTSNSNANGNVNPPLLLRPMSLREQQVARLRGEMAHAGGVRIRLRNGDYLPDAMALADGYGTVWICGWKQRTHPLLYNALHIGDRLAIVGRTTITSVKQAKQSLKDTFGLYHVELVIKRLPHGHVYTLKKNSDTQDLGLIMDSSTIVEVIPGSPADQAGVAPNGTLTEVNGRPLNLLLKKGDTQVRDRLNAIGRDVSILVQPTEFVALLRASLRSMRGYKDYIVQ